MSHDVNFQQATDAAAATTAEVYMYMMREREFNGIYIFIYKYCKCVWMCEFMKFFAWICDLKFKIVCGNEMEMWIK